MAISIKHYYKHKKEQTGHTNNDINQAILRRLKNRFPAKWDVKKIIISLDYLFADLPSDYDECAEKYCNSHVTEYDI